jgi:predicted transcriptional regulator of viral defense system
MKKVTSDIKSSLKIKQFQEDMNGIFTTADLYHIIGAQNPIANQRAINRLVQSNALTRVKRGLYVSDEFDLWLLAMKIKTKCYISLDSVISKNGLAGTLSRNRISLVTLGKPQTLKIEKYRIDIFSISKELFFGFQKNDQGILIADNEKAFIDLLYYYNRGYKFIFDPRVEVNIDKLDLKKIEFYLKKYKNSKFIKFVKGILYER